MKKLLSTLILTVFCISWLCTNVSAQLTFVNKIFECQDGIYGLTGPKGITMSPDKKNIYTTAQYSMSVFSYDTITGELTFIQSYKDGEDGFNGLYGSTCVVVSHDNKNVYVVSESENCLSICDRDTNTGLLAVKRILWDNVNGNPGLLGACSIAISNDDRFLYVTAWNDNKVSMYERDTTTGNLIWLQTLNGHYANGMYNLKMSNDNNYIYITSYNHNVFYIYKRNPATGAMTYFQTVQNGVDGVQGLLDTRTFEISHDDKFLYVLCNSSLVVFLRNTSTGLVTYLTTYTNGVGGINGMGQNYSITIPPDDRSVYTVSYIDSSLTTFSRDTSSGLLTYVNNIKINGNWINGGIYSSSTMISTKNDLILTCYWGSSVKTYLRNPLTSAISYHKSYNSGQGATIDGLALVSNSAVSPDNKNVYTISKYDGISIFTRSDTLGKLTFTGVIKENETINGITDAKSILITPDNKYVYVSSNIDDAIAVFGRDTSNGRLNFIQTIYNNQGGVNGLDGATSIAMSPDSAFIYVGSSDGIAIFTYNSINGSLGFVEFIDFFPLFGVSLSIEQIKISNDGYYLFAITLNNNDIYMFKRNISTGHLTRLAKYVNNYYKLKSFDISHDSKNLYAIFNSSNYIKCYSIDQANDTMYSIQGLNSDINHIEMTRNPCIVSVCSDDRFVFVASLDSSAINIFQRDPLDGKLTLFKSYREHGTNCEGLDGINSASYSPDKKNVYFTSNVEYGIAAYRIDACLGKNISACVGDTALLNLGNIYDSYQWSNGDSTSTISITSNGIFAVTVTDKYGISQTDTIAVNFNALPIVYLGSDTGVCTNNTFMLNAGSNFVNYTWNNGATSQTIPVSSGGNYTVVVTDSNGCRNSDTINIIVFPVPSLNLGADTGICSNTNYYLDAGDNNLSYIWNIGDTTQSISISTAGIYSVTITDSNHCKNADTINIQIYQAPIIDLGKDTTIQINQSLILDPFGSYNYLWSTGANAPSITIDRSLFTTDSLVVWVNVTNYNNCFTSDTIVIHLDSIFSVPYEIYPNPFNNNINIECNKEIMQIRIFDISGKCLYFSNVNKNAININTEFLNKGIYLLKLITLDSIISQKIIKTK